MKLTDRNLNTNDVRMRGFKYRSPVDNVIEWLDQQSINLPEQLIPIHKATGRVLAHNMTSHINIPNFTRSMMDGYAIIASDAQGASAYNQIELQIVSQSMPGKGTDIPVTPGTAIKIMTGAPLPKGANAVLPAENIDLADDSSIMIMENVAEGRNIGRIGEDVQADSVILKQGRRLRPQDIALLASIGKKEVSVNQQLRIKIVVTGNEILPTGRQPLDFKITNSNGPMLEALSHRDGAIVISSSIIPDDPELIKQAILTDDYNILLITGGTSVGEEDLVPVLLSELGQLKFHGVAMRPSRSTGIAMVRDKYAFLLPGNPVACLCAYDFFAGRFIRHISGYKRNLPYHSIHRKLKQKLTSVLGRTDYARISLSTNGTIEPIAISGAAILSSTTRADGFIIVPANCEGYAAETEVEVFLYD